MCMCGYICFSTYKSSAERSKIQKQNTGHEYFELGKRPNFFGDSQSTTIIMCQVPIVVWPCQPFSICPGWIYLSQLIDLEQRDPKPRDSPQKYPNTPIIMFHQVTFVVGPSRPFSICPGWLLPHPLRTLSVIPQRVICLYLVFVVVVLFL